MKQDNPGGVGLTLVLSDSMFTKYGYGPDKIKEIID